MKESGRLSKELSEGLYQHFQWQQAAAYGVASSAGSITRMAFHLPVRKRK
jgi:hypothetical protein